LTRDPFFKLFNSVIGASTKFVAVIIIEDLTTSEKLLYADTTAVLCSHQFINSCTAIAPWFSYYFLSI